MSPGLFAMETCANCIWPKAHSLDFRLENRKKVSVVIEDIVIVKLAKKTTSPSIPED
jgi:hypothetical protein